MSEEQTMLAEMADGLFGELAAAPDDAGAWQRLEEVGLADLLVAEDAGGFGGSWDDARVVFRLAGYHGLAEPLVEAALARHVGSRNGYEGYGALAGGAAGTLDTDSFTGDLHSISGPLGASYVVAPFEGRTIIVDLAAAQISQGTAISGETRASAHVEGARALQTDDDVLALAAFARSAQIAGALDAALSRSVEYVNGRKQFGRPLAKFQAVQQSLATFACEAAAANCAAIGAAQALDRGNASFEIAAAKLRANMAAGTGASIAHQVHGAIGFTEEYPLHRLTRRLWTWRSEMGGDAHWSQLLGARVLERGADNFWPDMTALTD